MEITNKLQDRYGPAEDMAAVEQKTGEILSKKSEYENHKYLKTALSCIDLTTLNQTDNKTVAEKLCNNVNSFKIDFPDLPNIAAICVYPALLEEIKIGLRAPKVSIAAVGAGFPASQTFLSVKLAECKLLASRGADEIDIVMSVGKFLEGEFQYVADEISLIREATGGVHLKVILETGKLSSPENIRVASLLAMEAGADFIKTSTGKESPAASPEAVYVMSRAISDYYKASGRKIGVKPAGGISTPEDALNYICIVGELLGKEWLNPGLFRIGASRLANNLLSEIIGKTVVFF
jgi:deoxyribose-phosphate aldolase